MMTQTDQQQFSQRPGLLHIKPLCHHCQYYRTATFRFWEGLCLAQNVILWGPIPHDPDGDRCVFYEEEQK
jgi:hypothetical protein